MNLLVALIPLLLTASPAPWALYTEQAMDAPRAAVVAARPEARLVLGEIDVLPNYEPFTRLSPQGGALYLVRHGHPNRQERTAQLLRFDLKRRAFDLVADGVDADPPLPLGDDAVAWIETVQTLPPAAEGELEGVTLSLRAWIAGETVELARLEDVWGAHFVGQTEEGIALYLVTRREAAFYVLPFARERLSDAAAPAGLEALRRVAPAPTGPFARDFALQGSTLFFGAPTEDRRARGLFALDLTPGHAAGARCLDKTGKAHPAPIAASKRVLYVRESSAGEAVAALDLEGELSFTAAPETAPRRRTVAQTRGSAQILALDALGEVFLMRRAFGTDAELLWRDGRSKVTRRLRTERFYSVVGLVEASW